MTFLEILLLIQTLEKFHFNMKVKEIFDLSTKLGIEADFRGKEGIEKLLKRKKEKYEKLSDEQKKFYDIEALENPFLDSRVFNLAEDKDIKKILAGVDIDGAELIVGKNLGVDLVIGHHPQGRGLANLGDVMNLQVDVLHQYGVPVNQAERLTNERISEVSRSVHSANHFQNIDLAKLLNLNFINSHTPCDNLAANFLNQRIEGGKFEYVEDIIKAVEDIPEYKEAKLNGAGPEVFVGSPENRCGKIALTEITGGTEGSEKLYEKMAHSGIGTIVAMHMSERNKKEAEASNINVLVVGHLSSDSLGMNLFLDELEKKGIEIIPCGGLTRIKRF